MPENSFDLIVIGAGPGGYVAAIRAAQLGFKTACVEREFLGGTCLNIGCIPSKALLDSSERYYDVKHSLGRHGIKIDGSSIDLLTMMKRKDEVVKGLTGGVGYLFKKNKIEHLKGSGRILSPGSVEVSTPGSAPAIRRTQRILIATGSAPIQLPALPFDEKFIVSSTGGLALTEIPKRLLVVGAGYIGVELGSVWSRLGSEVLILEFLDRALPGMDKEMAGQLQKLLEKQGLKFRFNTVAQSARVESGHVTVNWKTGEQSGTEVVDKVLVAVGRRPVTDNLGLRELGVVIDSKGFVKVNEKFETNINGIYAIGDVIGGLMLAHKAEEEGVAAAELMAGKGGHVNYQACPAVVYTHPELAQVGMTEEDAAKRGPIKVGRFPFTANGRAKGMDATDGLVKVIADAATDRILGVHILGAHASDVIAEATLAMEFAASSEDIARAFHAHPTMPEALKEAALAVDKRSIHI
ncbi:MAG TPA: dihydrolipoyl dehydrogenase [Tepidisphaeraceae bacterium]|nr:dihydrolipoyl dehydrogenase [Tepidisphaeraceae bacterium]